MDKRKITQIISALVYNANIKGFFTNNIYKGPLKNICIPGLNCYSCPGAIGSCPIGAVQAVITTAKYNITFYVLGFIALFGILTGRFICGWLCPFGFIQDLTYKIPFYKLKVNRTLNKILSYLKYVFLLLFVIFLPLVIVNQFGLGTPYFCKYVCPVGTLEGGIPLVLFNESLRNTLGFLFGWKMFILIIIIILSISLYRVFCRYICPLGALYSLFNKISFYKYHIDKDKCTECLMCVQKCKMNIDVYKNLNSLECIRCGECIKKCPTGALSAKIEFLHHKGK